jgi:hypothetical protein
MAFRRLEPEPISDFALIFLRRCAREGRLALDLAIMGIRKDQHYQLRPDDYQQLLRMAKHDEGLHNH